MVRSILIYVGATNDVCIQKLVKTYLKCKNYELLNKDRLTHLYIDQGKFVYFDSILNC